MKNQIIAATTALTIAMAALVPNAASAAPFNGLAKAEIQTDATGIETVGNRGRNAAGAAIIGLGAFALGAAVASGNNRGYRGHGHGHRRVYQRDCYIEKVRVWNPRRGHYVMHKEKVCY
ncbi:hypothetical protein [Acuticoccus kandeliae]|uniref:hypothetical protein n=1 Tax=Acuticoccus kandeliae TaxID=2073160 RepID=UPI000D3E4135|nr:hypothetical protein [Acuticoccus kandeliae]